jgi:serpin B
MLTISSLIHGTEAAAATGVVIGITSVPMPNPEFRVDRPFIFMICDNTKNTIIFMGKINDPVME